MAAEDQDFVVGGATDGAVGGGVVCRVDEHGGDAGVVVVLVLRVVDARVGDAVHDDWRATTSGEKGPVWRPRGRFPPSLKLVAAQGSALVAVWVPPGTPACAQRCFLIAQNFATFARAKVPRSELPEPRFRREQ